MTKEKDCDVCHSLDSGDERRRIIQTEYWAVDLSERQTYLGRSYVTSLDHKQNLRELTDDEWDDFRELVRKLERATKDAFNATMFNWTCLTNNAFQDEKPKPHVHWHFRPRYKEPTKLEDRVFKDPAFGYHYRTYPDNGKTMLVNETKVDQNTLGLIAKRFREYLES